MHGIIPPLPQYVFMAWCLVKNRDNFTLQKDGMETDSLLMKIGLIPSLGLQQKLLNCCVNNILDPFFEQLTEKHFHLLPAEYTLEFSEWSSDFIH
jgi:hypothetical protein